MTEWLHFHFSLSCIGEGNGNPLQCSCLENPRDRGASWAAIYGVAQSWTRLKPLSSSSSRADKKRKKKLLHKIISMWLKTSVSLLSELSTWRRTASSLSTPIATLSWGHLAELLKVLDNRNRSAACTVTNKTAIFSRPHIYKVEVLPDFYQCDRFYLFPITLCHFLGNCKLTFPVFQNFSHVEGNFSTYFTFTYLHFYNSMFVSIMIEWTE